MHTRFKLLTAAVAASIVPCPALSATAVSAPVVTAPDAVAGPAGPSAALGAVQTRPPAVPVPPGQVPVLTAHAPTPQPAAPQNPAVPQDAAAAPSDPPSRLPAAPSSLLSNQGGAPAAPVSSFRFTPASTFGGPGGLAAENPTAGPLPISLDDAIALGLKRNFRLKYEIANQRAVRGYQGQIKNAIIPNLQFKAASTAQQVNLAAMGFNPAKLGPLFSQFGLDPSAIHTIVKVNTTSAQLSVSQQIFNMPDFELLRAVKPELKTVDLNKADSAEQLVQAVTTAYLRVLADQANLRNSIAQENSSKVSLDQATARDQAGVGIRLDVLRARVDFQQRQQAHVSADNQLNKDTVQLNRIMGTPAGQQLELTDDAPYQEFGAIDLLEARQTAMQHRNDLLAIQQSLLVAGHELKAVRYQRLPTLSVNGFYGVVGETTGLYHGAFAAAGSLRVPVFREAAQQGEQHSAQAQLQQLQAQEENLRGTIEAQIRTSVLDIETSSQMVKVAQSNVELARQELVDARERFHAGITDNLEVVDAETAVTSTQAQLVNALFQFNAAKIALARNTGVLQSRYRAFLGM